MAIPITLRLATRVLQGASVEAVASAIAAVQLETEAVSESEEFAASLRCSFIEEADWKALMDEAGEAHRDFKYVKAQTLMVGAILKSPPDQSLYLQVRLMETLGRLFSGESSLYRAIVAPFVVEYWKAQAVRPVHPFRTAQAYTLRQLELSDGSVDGTRRLLSAMRFCMGVTLPVDATVWLDREESKT